MRYESRYKKTGDQEKSDRALLAWSSNLYVLYSYVRVDRISFRSEKVLRGSSGTIINFNGASTVPRGGNRCENVSCWGERLATYNSTPWFWSIHELTRPWFFCIPRYDILRERLSHSIAVLCSYWLFRTHREMKNMRYTSVVIGLKLVRELMECIDLKKIYRVKGFVEGFGEWKWFDISAYEIFFFFLIRRWLKLDVQYKNIDVDWLKNNEKLITKKSIYKSITRKIY